MDILLKICTKCNIEQSTENFGIKTSKGRKYVESWCRICKAEARKQFPRFKNEESRILQDKKKLAKKRHERANNINAERHILDSCKSMDRKKNFTCDLDLEFVKSLIAKPCAYCDATDLKMTLDRIDNSIGHLKTNVIQSCYRCNLTRGSMPYAAWLVVSKGMKEARELGLFGDWREKPFARKPETDVVLDEDISKLEEKVTLNIQNNKDQNGSNPNRWQKVSDEVLLQALKSHGSMTAALKSVGMAPMGSNFTRAKRVLGLDVSIKLSTKAIGVQIDRDDWNFDEDAVRPSKEQLTEAGKKGYKAALANLDHSALGRKGGLANKGKPKKKKV